MAGTDELILFIGKGPQSLEETWAGEYRQATYFLPARPEETHRTPFVAEALIRLTERNFDRVHILGTCDAMWDVLLARSGSDFEDEIIETLVHLEEERPSDLPSPLRSCIQEVVGEHLGVSVEPHLIPVGASTKRTGKSLGVLLVSI